MSPEERAHQLVFGQPWGADAFFKDPKEAARVIAAAIKEATAEAYESGCQEGTERAEQIAREHCRALIQEIRAALRPETEDELIEEQKRELHDDIMEGVREPWDTR